MGYVFSLIGRWLAVVAVCVVVKLLPSLWYEFKGMRGLQADEFTATWIAAFAILAIASVETFRSIDSLLDRKSQKVLRHAVSALLASLLFLYPWWGYDLGNPIEHARFALLQKRYDECAAAAHRSYGSYKFNTCERRFVAYYAHYIVYDTSGQIARRRDARSSEFADYLKKSESRVYSECRQATTEFAPHYFHTEMFLCDPPSE